MKRMLLLAASLPCLAWLGGCTLPLGRDGPQPSAEALSACNQRADQEYLSQNRNALYSADRYDTSTRDAPYASMGLPQQNEADLSAQYERNQDLKDCLNGGANQGPPAAPSSTTEKAP